MTVDEANLKLGVSREQEIKFYSSVEISGHKHQK